MIGVFHPGTSPVHRTPALAKLGLLAVLVIEDARVRFDGPAEAAIADYLSTVPG